MHPKVEVRLHEGEGIPALQGLLGMLMGGPLQTTVRPEFHQ